MDTWEAGRGETTVEAVMQALSPWLADADGITVSGGEPFDQPEALHELLLRLRAATAGDMLVYSGYSRESLAPLLAEWAGLIDGLVSEPFRAEAPQTLALRGSDNQRLHLLTPLGEERLREYERPLRAADRKLDIHFDDDGTVWMAGIPHRGDMHRLSAILSAGGHSVVSTDAKPLRKRLKTQP